MKILFLLLFLSVVLYADEPYPTMEGFSYDSSFAVWNDDRLIFDDRYGIPDSLKIIAVDTSDTKKIYEVVRIYYESFNDFERISDFPPDGIYYKIGFFFFTAQNFQTAVAKMEYKQQKLVYPEHNEYNISLSPELRWQPSLGATEHTEYELQVSTDSDFDNLIVHAFTKDTTYNIQEHDLMTNLERYWINDWVFDGTQDAQIESDFNFEVQTFTLALWMKPDQLGQEFTSVMMGVAREGGGFQNIVLSYKPEGVIRYRTYHNTSHSWESTVTIPPNEWTFIVGTYNNGNKKLYINGELHRETNVSGDIDFDGSPFIIGADLEMPEGRRYSGMLRRMGFWSRPLSKDEISILYDEGINIDYPLNIQVLDFYTQYYWRVRPWGRAGAAQWSGK